ncbi:MAG: hypothetical protein ACJASG_001893 [Oleiphilaceae bacterium]|jgi:hypothetical protein
MKLDTVNNWVILVANIGVLAGIVFLAYELKQNTVATQLEAASNLNTSFADIEMLIAGDTDFSGLLIKGRSGAVLTANEEFRLGVFYGNVLRQWQFIHFQFLTDALDEEIWLGQLAYFTMVISSDQGLLEHWRTSRNHFSPRFNILVQSMISADDLDPADDA